MSPLLLAEGALSALFIGAWWWQQRSANAGWADVIWAYATGLLGALWGLTGSGDPGLGLAVACIYLLWFGRLGWHLHQRVQGAPEEGRYRYMREWAGERACLVFLVFFLMQASWVWLFALPAYVVAQGALPPLWALLLAGLILATAWTGEMLADRQLARFKARPDSRGRTCREGLWRYSRHPNYFFEWLQWFAWPLLGLAAPFGQWLWLAPVVVFIFLYFVTGIPFTEKQALRSRGEDYRHYQQTTSMFFPWKPSAASALPSEQQKTETNT